MDLPFEDGSSLIETAAEQKFDEILFSTWLVRGIGTKTSFEEYKRKAEPPRFAMAKKELERKTPDEILLKVKSILDEMGGENFGDI